jgi:Na+-driven multidrug efflux pump
MVHNILNIGIPSGVENSMFQIGRLLSQRIFTYFGTSAMAGNAIASVVNSFSFMPGQAFGMTLLTVVGQCVGARDYDGARRYAKKILFLSCCSIGVISLSIYIFMEPLVSLISLSVEAHEMANTFLRVHCVFMALGWTMSFALPSALRAAGDARYVMIIAVISMWALRVSFSYILTFFFKIGPVGVWFAMGSDFIFRGSCYLSRWLGGRWRYKKVITDS